MIKHKSNFRTLQKDVVRLLPLTKKGVRKLNIGIKRTRKTLKALGAREALKLGFRFTHNQIKIRPRARLFTKFIAVLALLFAVASPAAGYLNARRADVVIAGHKILVAQAIERPTPEINIDQEISARKSPFEFYKPADGYISQGFNSYHRANDIAAPFGSPVHAIGEGTVVFAGMVYDGHGNMVIIDHSDGLKSAYSHMGRIDVGVGNQVDGETKIGTVGLTGRTTGAHVHMEIIDNDTYVDPSGILPGLTPR